ncbi:MAG: protein-tyrosine phosphatase family protein [Methylococcaceae bacterium]
MTKPIKNSYPVIPGKFFAGEYPRDASDEESLRKINLFLDFGITDFIDLTQEMELKPYQHWLNNARHHRFPIRDVSIPHSPALTQSILDTIDELLAQDRKVYLHCWGGIGRTGVIVGCWLSRHGLKGEEALYRLNELWQECPKSSYTLSPQTMEQHAYVICWEESDPDTGESLE